MLLFTLLENGLLSAERGDVVVFNNTSCEHPETYRFAATCKEIVEQRYGIPFFWVEFQTYEDARRGEWAASGAIAWSTAGRCRNTIRTASAGGEKCSRNSCRTRHTSPTSFAA